MPSTSPRTFRTSDGRIPERGAPRPQSKPAHGASATRWHSGIDDHFDEAFDRSFSIVAFHLNRHYIDYMLRAVRELDVDYESLVVWGVLSHQNILHLLPPGTAPAE